MNGTNIVRVSSLNNGYITAIDSRQKVASGVSYHIIFIQFHTILNLVNWPLTESGDTKTNAAYWQSSKKHTLYLCNPK